jgi:Predicted signal transduction protein with a C-terminal ATPase domain
MNIKNKLILSYILVSLIPIIVLGYYLTNRISNDMLDQTKKFYESSARDLNKSIVNRLYSYADIVDSVVYDKNLAYYLNMSVNDDISLYNDYINKVEPLINRIQYKENQSIIKIYTRNELLKFSGIFIRDTNIYNKLLKTIKGTERNICWSGISTEKGHRYIRFISAINDYFYSNETVGVLEMQIDTNIFNSLLNEDARSKNIVFVYDDKGNLLAANKNTSKVQNDTTSYLDVLKHLNETVIKYNNEDYLFIKNYITDNKLNIEGWNIGYLIPLSDIRKNTFGIWITSILLSFLCLLLSILVTFLLSRNITKRLGVLITKMHKVKKGDFNISTKIEGKDEITELDDHFNVMVNELVKLMNEVYEAKLKIKNTELMKQMAENAEKEAKLLTLQSQINPHYLFNTMETIRMNLLLKGDKETAEIIKLFGESFRIMISEENELVTIKDELNFVKTYFQIQKYRYGEKLNIKFNIEERALESHISKFLLQPLIENAIYHGLELKDGPGLVEVVVAEEDGYIDIKVTDDGVGIAADKLAELIEALDEDNVKNRNYALRNINKRIKLLYGEKAEFFIKSKPDIGTSVDIRLPKEE